MNREIVTLQSILIEEIRQIINRSKESLNDEEVLKIIEQTVLNDPRVQGRNYKDKKRLILNIFNATRKDLDILQPLIEDPIINEVMVNGKDAVFIEREGRILRLDMTFPKTEDLEEVLMRISAKVHREINELNPILDARLEDGSRVHAVYKNIAIGGPILTIRKFPEKKMTMKQWIDMGSITWEAADFLQKMVQAGFNIFISGGTSSGKTTFLNVLSDYIPAEERVIVIEDSAELQIDQIDNLIRMETKNANVQGKGKVTMQDLIKASLRMRPDRLIIGEVRSSEAVDMIQALNTGHDGSLSTGHANSVKGMLNRLENMFLQGASFPLEAIRSQIASAIDIMVHLGRLRDRSRKVLEISELCGYEKGELLLNPLFVYKNQFKEGGEKECRCLTRTQNPLKNTLKLEMREISL